MVAVVVAATDEPYLLSSCLKICLEGRNYSCEFVRKQWVGLESQMLSQFINTSHTILCEKTMGRLGKSNIVTVY